MPPLSDLDDAAAAHDWPAIQRALTAWPDDASRGQAVDHAHQLVDDWGHQDLAATAEDWRAIQGGAPPPAWWPLARYLKLDDDQDLDPIDALRDLRGLDASQSEVELDDIGQLAALEELQLAHLDLEDLELLRPLTRVMHLEIVACKQLRDISAIEAMPELRVLSLAGCPHVASIAALAHTPYVFSLDLRGTRDLDSLAPVSALAELDTLIVHDCPWLSDLSPLAALDQLRVLGLERCRNLASLAPLRGLAALEELSLSHARLADVDALADLPALTEVALRDLPMVQALPAIAAVESFLVDRLPSLSRAALPAGAPRRVQLAACPALVAVTGHDADHAPVSLELRNVGLRDLGFLRHSDALEVLIVSGAPALADLGGLSAVQALRHLVITYCDAVADLSPLTTLTRLETLDLKHCPAIHDLRPLRRLPALSVLDLTGCTADRAPLAGASFQIVG